MRVECPSCKHQFHFQYSNSNPQYQSSILVQCPGCGMGGRISAALGPLAAPKSRAELAMETVGAPVDIGCIDAEPRTVSFICGCGYHTDLPERYRYRMGSCPACHEWVMAGEGVPSPGLYVHALKEVQASMESELGGRPEPVLQMDRRLAPRIPAMQLTAQLRDVSPRRFPVGNVSNSGIALLSMPGSLEHAQPVTLNLQEKGASVLRLVKTRLVRIGGDSAGLAFEELNMAQRRDLRLLLARTACRSNVVGIAPGAPGIYPLHASVA